LRAGIRRDTPQAAQPLITQPSANQKGALAPQYTKRIPNIIFVRPPLEIPREAALKERRDGFLHEIVTIRLRDPGGGGPGKESLTQPGEILRRRAQFPRPTAPFSVT